MITPEDARTMWCPMVRGANHRSMGGADPTICSVNQTETVTDQSGSRCIANDCMMWRWGQTGHIQMNVGYCGLAGRPGGGA